MKKYVIGIFLGVFVTNLGFAAEPARLRVGILLAGEFVPTYIAHKKGYFRLTVEQFFKGFLEGVQYAKTHKEESVRLIKEFSGRRGWTRSLLRLEAPT